MAAPIGNTAKAAAPTTLGPTIGSLTLQQRADEQLQSGQSADEPQQSQRPRQPQNRGERPADGQQAQHDNQKVEHVPTVREVAPGLTTMRGHLEQRLDHKHAEDELVQPQQDCAVAFHHGRTGFQAGYPAGQHYHRHDEVVEQFRCNELVDGFGHGEFPSWVKSTLPTRLPSRSMGSKPTPALTNAKPSLVD